MIMNLQRSPLGYQGNKFKLLPELLPELGKPSVFHDVFGGSATVALNMVDRADRVCYNEYDRQIFRVMKRLADRRTKTTVKRVIRIAESNGLSSLAEEEYYAFREVAKRYDLPLFYFIVSKFSYCNLLRFSSKGCNIPFGHGRLKGGLRASAYTMLNAVRSISRISEFHNLSYLQYVKHAIAKADGSHVFYFDPPYLASGANAYKGHWTLADEQRLLDMLDYMNRKGLRWVLSNVFEHRGHHNKTLVDWSGDYKVIYPDFGKKKAYNLDRARKNGKSVDNKTVEVIIKNF
jgi:site-specific DNA-adenine methylase